MKSRFHELATSELTEAITYYDSKSEGLGDRLLAEVRSAVAHIEQYLFYIIGETEISILAVAHESRRPGYWRSRIR